MHWGLWRSDAGTRRVMQLAASALPCPAFPSSKQEHSEVTLPSNSNNFTPFEKQGLYTQYFTR